MVIDLARKNNIVRRGDKPSQCKRSFNQIRRIQAISSRRIREPGKRRDFFQCCSRALNPKHPIPQVTRYSSDGHA